MDNYDSFTFNLVQGFEVLGARCTVVRSDELDIGGLLALEADGVVLSPGPSSPDRSGLTLACVQPLAGRLPLLGVCLGHQAIAQSFGARVVGGRPVHGKPWSIEHDGSPLYAGLPSPFPAARYHSLVVDPASMPDCLRVSAWTAEGEIMGLRHATFDIQGVQFHPESIASPRGLDLLANWVRSL